MVNSVAISKLKTKGFETIAAPLCLGDVSKTFSVDNAKKNGLYEYVLDFSADCNKTEINDILDIHEYLIKKYKIK